MSLLFVGQGLMPLAWLSVGLIVMVFCFVGLTDMRLEFQFRPYRRSESKRVSWNPEINPLGSVAYDMVPGPRLGSGVKKDEYRHIA